MLAGAKMFESRLARSMLPLLWGEDVFSQGMREETPPSLMGLWAAGLSVGGG